MKSNRLEIKLKNIFNTKNFNIYAYITSQESLVFTKVSVIHVKWNPKSSIEIKYMN